MRSCHARADAHDGSPAQGPKSVARRFRNKLNAEWLWRRALNSDAQKCSDEEVAALRETRALPAAWQAAMGPGELQRALLTPLLTKWHENRSEAARAEEAITEKLPHEARCALEFYGLTLARIEARTKELEEAQSFDPNERTADWARSQATGLGQLDALTCAHSRYVKLYHRAAYLWGPSSKRRGSRLRKRDIMPLLPDLPKCSNPDTDDALDAIGDALAAAIERAVAAGVAAAEDYAAAAAAQGNAVAMDM